MHLLVEDCPNKQSNQLVLPRTRLSKIKWKHCKIEKQNLWKLEIRIESRSDRIIDSISRIYNYSATDYFSGLNLEKLVPATILPHSPKHCASLLQLTGCHRAHFSRKERYSEDASIVTSFRDNNGVFFNFIAHAWNRQKAS